MSLHTCAWVWRQIKNISTHAHFESMNVTTVNLNICTVNQCRHSDRNSNTCGVLPIDNTDCDFDQWTVAIVSINPFKQLETNQLFLSLKSDSLFRFHCDYSHLLQTTTQNWWISLVAEKKTSLTPNFETYSTSTVSILMHPIDCDAMDCIKSAKYE